MGNAMIMRIRFVILGPILCKDQVYRLIYRVAKLRLFVELDSAEILPGNHKYRNPAFMDTRQRGTRFRGVRQQSVPSMYKKFKG